ncbi:MAG: hypothetical protein PHG48_02880 [Eubacteriales bacterium]|nr:hypothetical protein [Eubacteriales bacterium]
MKLPEIKEERRLKLKHFPTPMQAFIFRNWEMVPLDRLASILGTEPGKVARQAEKMGLPPQKETSMWQQKGYITIIRSNWHILPYDQLLELLGWDADKLAMILKEDDFLEIKLGRYKHGCTRVEYTELSLEQEKETSEIKAAMDEYVRRYDREETAQPFEFFSHDDETGTESGNSNSDGTKVGNLKVINNTNDPDIWAFLKKITGEFYDKWGIDICDELVLKYCDDKKQRRISEYHEITVESGRITIIAADRAGIIRGLVYLADMADARGGPFYIPGIHRRTPRFDRRIIYSYCGLYTTAFDVDSRIYLPDELLYKYAKTGVNGIWLQAVLYLLTEFPFEPSMSKGWEKRLSNLKELADRAWKFGIKIYLYLNEPRSMPLDFYTIHPELKGHVADGHACMCTSVPQVRKYLYDAVQSLCRAVPGIGGFFTITSSENLTNCHSHSNSDGSVNCPRCGDRKKFEVIAEVNTVIDNAARGVSSEIKTFAWTWGWRLNSKNVNEEEEKEKCIAAIPAHMGIMATGEHRMPYMVGGISGIVSDYTLSIIGPGDVSISEWQAAKKTGHPTAAKVQFNCTWECSTVPFLPVYGNIIKYLKNLSDAGVESLLLSWTLGGYPSPNIKIASAQFFSEILIDEKSIKFDGGNGDGGNGDVGNCSNSNNLGKNISEDEAYDSMFSALYGENAALVRKATDIFCEAFREFPFHIRVAYFAPQNGGPSNLLFDEPTGLEATMTCFVYDDLEKWRSIYPVDIFENQFRLLSEKWEKGLRLLDKLPPSELKDAAESGYSLFKSSYDQIRFVRARDAFIKEKDSTRKNELHGLMKELIKDELKTAVKVYRIMLRNPTIGYEAANHYYFSRQMLAEKIINCSYLLRKI